VRSIPVVWYIVPRLYAHPAVSLVIIEHVIGKLVVECSNNGAFILFEKVACHGKSRFCILGGACGRIVAGKETISSCVGTDPDTNPADCSLVRCSARSARSGSRARKRRARFFSVLVMGYTGVLLIPPISSDCVKVTVSRPPEMLAATRFFGGRGAELTTTVSSGGAVATARPASS